MGASTTTSRKFTDADSVDGDMRRNPTNDTNVNAWMRPVLQFIYLGQKPPLDHLPARIVPLLLCAQLPFVPSKPSGHLPVFHASHLPVSEPHECNAKPTWRGHMERHGPRVSEGASKPVSHDVPCKLFWIWVLKNYFTQRAMAVHVPGNWHFHLLCRPWMGDSLNSKDRPCCFLAKWNARNYFQRIVPFFGRMYGETGLS
jgi:hypothetical protein